MRRESQPSLLVFCEVIAFSATQRTRSKVALDRSRARGGPLLSLIRARRAVVPARTSMALLLIMTPRRLLSLFLIRGWVVLTGGDGTEPVLHARSDRGS